LHIISLDVAYMSRRFLERAKFHLISFRIIPAQRTLCPSWEHIDDIFRQNFCKIFLPMTRVRFQGLQFCTESADIYLQSWAGCDLSSPMMHDEDTHYCAKEGTLNFLIFRYYSGINPKHVRVGLTNRGNGSRAAADGNGCFTLRTPYRFALIRIQKIYDVTSSGFLFKYSITRKTETGNVRPSTASLSF